MEKGNLKEEIKLKFIKDGWSENEIENYGGPSDLDILKVAVLDTLIQIIYYKYASFKINFNPNLIALDFLKKTIEEKIMSYIIYRMELFEKIIYSSHEDASEEDNKKKLSYRNDQILIQLGIELERIIKRVSSTDTIYRKGCSNEIEELISCLISLTGLQLSDMNLFIKRVEIKY